ncbi:Alcohol dehydrogenase superfamily zinc-type [Penicillium argentinense]|uniref:Alcohol dehydrogenase superfamily zinc-type n=1 Tax=Penicillium argentinense TaxID=1131581 RepID=A0A9W9KP00_9EURO|nr:Alcohol dehydrogenase superfamily zinc-type [Penicillium argentinense]KAJ5112513.1 Alcohol dehydrogenase superfamily zinc-type [Penicillium argentinense]
MTIPSTQIAAVVASSGASASSRVDIVSTHPVPAPGDGDLLVKLEYSGVCHSDVHSIKGDTPMLTDVAGHEGVGTVVAGGFTALVSAVKFVLLTILLVRSRGMPARDVSTYVVLKCIYLRTDSNADAIEYIVSPAIHSTRIPQGLSPELAAPLLCAGIAMYSSIMKTKPRPGYWLAPDILCYIQTLTLSYQGVQIAAKKGLNVVAIDKGATKKDLCLSLGAKHFLDFTVVDIVQAVKTLTSGLGAHSVICTANSPGAYEQSVQMLRPLGTLVCVGIPGVPFNLPATPFDMIIRGLTIVGNSAGTAKEMDELLAMAVAGDVKAHVKVFELAEIHDILERLEKSEVEGRIVLKIPA